MEPLEIAEDQVRCALSFMHCHNGRIELRPFDLDANRQSGIYTDRKRLVTDAADFAGNAVYWTVNEIGPTIEATNRLDPARQGGCTQNRHIVRIRNIVLDFDPVRPTGQPATDAEHKAAIDLAQVVKNELGLPAPLVIDSGNGAYLIFATDLDPSLVPIVRAFVEAISRKYSTPGVTIDSSVWKLAQLIRVPGTWNRKAQATAERPHRQCLILEQPDREMVTAEMLLSMIPAPAEFEVADFDQPAAVQRERDWLDSRKVKYTVEEHHDATIFRFRVCPFKSGDQTDGRTWLRISNSGVTAGCWHSKCQKHGLVALRKAIGGYESNTARLTDPHRLAERHIERWSHGGQRTSLFIGEDFLVWKNGLYYPVTDKMLTPYVTDTIKTEFDEQAAKVKAQGGKGAPAMVKRAIVSDTLNALKHLSKLDTDKQPPFWLPVDHPDWQPDDIIPFANGLLHLPSWLHDQQGFVGHTPALYIRHRLAFDFDPNAPTPQRWTQFLNELWDDPACHDLVHEWGGYACFTRDTSLQKMLMLLGKPRGGKGTLNWLWGQMVGGNFAAPQFKSLLDSHGLAPLQGKQLCLFPDTKMMSEKVLSEVCAILKAITGEDPLTINPKNKQQVTEQLKIKIVIPSNDLLAIPDSSKALQARQLFLHFTESFVGKEDFQLKTKLLPEMSGIANLFLAGLRRLRDNGGRFTEPESSRKLAEQVTRAANPIKGFVAERCIVDPKFAIHTGAAYESYEQWCSDTDTPLWPVNEFGKELQSVCSITRSQNAAKFTITTPNYKSKGSRPYYYLGLRLA